MTSRSNPPPHDQASTMATDACHEIEQNAVPSPAPVFPEIDAIITLRGQQGRVVTCASFCGHAALIRLWPALSRGPGLPMAISHRPHSHRPCRTNERMRF